MQKQDRKKQLIQLVHIAANQLNHENDERCLIMLELTGKNSTKAMTIAELEKVMSYYKGIGFKPKNNSNKKMRPKLAKLFSLWQEMADAGLVKNRRFSALESWATKNCKGMNFDRAINKLDCSPIKCFIQLLNN